MTRIEIETEYKVNEMGIIVSPGKFEGEMVYIPHFWAIYLDGGADRDNGETLGFDVTAEDKAQFPELKRRKTVKLYVSNDGFVYEV